MLNRRRLPLLLLGGCVAFGQPQPGQAFTIAPKFRPGDAFELQLTRIKEDSRRPEANGRSTTPIAVTTLEAGSKGYVLSWRYGATTIVDGRKLPEGPMDAMAKRLQELSLEVKLDAEGSYQGLRNEAEALRFMESLLDALVKSLPDPQAAPTVRRLFSPQVQLAALTRDIQTYFGWNGAELESGKPVTITVDQPSPFGGTIPANITLRPEKLVNGLAYLTSTTAYPAGQLREMAVRAVQQASPQPLPPEALQNIPAPAMADTGRYVFDTTRGLMQELAFTRTTTAGPMRKLESSEYRLTAFRAAAQ